jgi:hypothetical protein
MNIMSWAEARLDFYWITKTDHMYTLHTLIDKQVKQNKGNIYSWFVDLNKAFDLILQSFLYKEIESGIWGKTFDVIKSMYTKKCGV